MFSSSPAALFTRVIVGAGGQDKGQERFHCGSCLSGAPFPLQIEELLKEVTLKETKKKKIDAFLHEINSLLSAIPETPETEVCPIGMEESVRPCMEQALILLWGQKSLWSVSFRD